jgi:hypothetical protein
VPVVHPTADEWTEEYVLYAASASSVRLTEPLAAFLDHATAERLRPVLFTQSGARLSPFVQFAMRRAGGHWAVQGPGGAFDGLSGLRIERFDDLWRRSGTDRDRAPGFGSVRADPQGVLMFDFYAHHRATLDTRVGELAAIAVESLGGGALDVWGQVEPLTEQWSPEALTAAVRRQMPVSQVLHAAGPTGVFCDVSAGRTRHGVLEEAKGGVPAGPYPSEPAALITRAGEALALLAERFRPTIGFVSLAETAPDGWVDASARRLEVPLAVLIGPRGVRDLGVDAEGLARQHDVEVVGRRRLPSLLVRFSRPDVGLWAQLLAFAYDLGVDRIAEATGLPLAGPATRTKGG